MNKSIFPNLFTASNLAFGVIGVTFSAQGNFTAAAICVLLSLLADGLDGRVARALGVSGPMGRELDSLADVVGFGVAPAYMLYMRCFQDIGWLGYVPLLIFSVLGAFRLARFNIKTDEVHGYFQGLPIPAAGCMASTFILSGVSVPAWLTMIVMIVVALLMVSSIHYPDFKGKGADKNSIIAIGIAAIVGAAILVWDWHAWALDVFVVYAVYGICNTVMGIIQR